jgi:hypothetical protein
MAPSSMQTLAITDLRKRGVLGFPAQPPSHTARRMQLAAPHPRGGTHAASRMYRASSPITGTVVLHVGPHGHLLIRCHRATGHGGAMHVG